MNHILLIQYKFCGERTFIQNSNLQELKETKKLYDAETEKSLKCRTLLIENVKGMI